jgi:hypothetical protein
MEDLTWKEKLGAYLKEKLKAAPRIILITTGISVALAIAYYVTMMLM